MNIGGIMMWYEKMIAELSVQPVQPWLVVVMMLSVIAVYVITGLSRPRETTKTEQAHPDFGDQASNHPDWF